ncbi:hypothetical protein AB0L99_46080, partial [Streptomyces sp. NPDC051954]
MPYDADAVRLRRVNRWQAQGVSGGLADPYVDSRETSPSEAYRPPGRQAFLNHLTTEIRRPGFAMVTAETNSRVGSAFGFPVRSDGFWWLGADHPTLTALRSRGWLDMGEIRGPISATLLRVLVLPVRERTVVRLGGLARGVWTGGPAEARQPVGADSGAGRGAGGPTWWPGGRG